MATWDDLVMAGQPRLINYPFDTTEDADWKFKVGPFGAEGSPVNLSTATFVCKVLSAVGGADIATWTVTGDVDGFLTGVLDDATTAVLTPSQTHIWYCYGTLSGARVYFWGPKASPFIIEKGA